MEREWKFSKAFPAEQKVPTREQILTELQRCGVGEAEQISLIDTTHSADDIRLNFVIDKRYVLRFVNAPGLSEQRFAELNRLIGRYNASGLRCPAFLTGTDGRFLHPWENLTCYCGEYFDLPLADECSVELDALYDEIHDFEAAFAERYRDFDLSETMGMYSLFDLDPFDVPEGIDEKQQNFNQLIEKLKSVGAHALADRLYARHAAVRERLFAIYRTLPRCFVQDDANVSNVLLDERQRFAGLIDFNLAGTEVIVNTFANWAGDDYNLEEKAPIGAQARLDFLLQKYRRDIRRALTIYHATETEKEALVLYAWIVMVAQWPLFCWFSECIDGGGAMKEEVLALLGLVADLDLGLLHPDA